MKQHVVVLPLTPEEAKNLAIMLDRVPVTGILEASCLVGIANKLGACVEQATKEAQNVKETGDVTPGAYSPVPVVHDGNS